MMRASSADVPGLVFDLWAAENRALNLYGKKETRPEGYRERLAHGWEASLCMAASRHTRGAAERRHHSQSARRGASECGPRARGERGKYDRDGGGITASATAWQWWRPWRRARDLPSASASCLDLLRQGLGWHATSAAIWIGDGKSPAYCLRGTRGGRGGATDRQFIAAVRRTSERGAECLSTLSSS